MCATQETLEDGGTRDGLSRHSQLFQRVTLVGKQRITLVDKQRITLVISRESLLLAAFVYGPVDWLGGGLGTVLQGLLGGHS
jgi:hypothetical protein